jgi:hypothetical protein
MCVSEEYSEVHIMATIILHINNTRKIPTEAVNVHISKGNSKNCNYIAKRLRRNRDSTSSQAPILKKKEYILYQTNE